MEFHRSYYVDKATSFDGLWLFIVLPRVSYVKGNVNFQEGHNSAKADKIKQMAWNFIVCKK